jgi:hypothetical protein
MTILASFDPARVRDLLQVDRLLRDRIDDHERRIGAVDGRLV